MSIRIVLADDHKVVRQGLRALLSAQADLQVVGEAADGLEAVELAVNLMPEVVVTDWMMPHLNGLDAAKQIRKRAPTVQVVMLSMHGNVAHVIQALRSGVIGYVLKDSDSQEVVNAVRAAAHGQRHIDPTLAAAVMEGFIHNDVEALATPTALTEREREVLQGIAEGHTNAFLAHQLNISLRTVETHRANLMRKIKVRSQAELVRYAIKHGLTEVE